MGDHGAVILVEVVLVFGGALAFGWWQLRDLAREKARREGRQRASQDPVVSNGTHAEGDSP
jgi:hypothetical protein